MKRLLIIMTPENQAAAKEFVQNFLTDIGQDNRMAMDAPYTNESATLEDGEPNPDYQVTHYVSCTTYSPAVEAALPHLPDAFSTQHPTLGVPILILCNLEGDGAPTPKEKLAELGLSPYNLN